MDDQEELLNILQTQGQEFLSSFSWPHPNQNKRKRTGGDGNGKSNVSKVTQGEESEEEWQGFSGYPAVLEEYNGFEERSDEGGDQGFEHEDDGFTADASSRPPDIVVFSDPRTKSIAPLITAKAQKKAFMSSKVSKLTQTIEDTAHAEEHGDDVNAEHTNLQNDALLHRLVHTKLLSGSLNSELELTPAQRKKALAGRVLEVSGRVKLGKGENAVREGERNRAAKRVREGLLDKKREREKKELEEAKNLGNYHPTLKKLYEPSSSSTSSSNKKRDRGLKMGVGKFNGGMLKLSKHEISVAQGNGTRGRGSSRGGGRGRGRGRS